MVLIIAQHPLCGSGCVLLRLFMRSMNATPLTKLFEFKTVLDNLLIFASIVTNALTFRTLHFDHGILGHRKSYKLDRGSGMV